jgi:hypothetical protein
MNPISEIPRKSSFEAYREFPELPASEVATVTATCVHCHVTV